jgi:SAM-dependent methyltransferase
MTEAYRRRNLQNMFAELLCNIVSSGPDASTMTCPEPKGGSPVLLNRVLGGTTKPAFLWLVRLIAVSALVLLPWAAYLALSLPASVSARHWPAAWTGLDVMMAAGLAATAWLAVRRGWRVALPAAAAKADARQLPFPGATFDAAYLVTALGEIPDPAAAVRELRRVIKPTGRIVVGEFLDRHYVPIVDLLSYGNAAGLELSGRLGPPLAYLARLRPGSSPTR